ncbi:MAG: glycosyltransferase family 39 protein [Burkholderiaceae bacterium]
MLTFDAPLSDASRARRAFAVVACVTLAARALLAAGLPITGDEAYFFWWGKFPDWGFYDHPPMVGWWLAALAKLSWHPFVLRLPALLVPLAVAGLAVACVRRHGEALAWVAGTLVLLAPLNVWNVAITTDIPLMLFAFAAVAALLRALRTGRAADYLLAGVLLGGALLSKYFAGMLALGIAAALVARPTRARLAGLGWVVAGSVPAAALQVAWNAQNCWPNLMFNLVNRHGDAGWSWKNPPLYLVSLAYVLIPAVAWALARRAAGRGDESAAGATAAGAGDEGARPTGAGGAAAASAEQSREARRALAWIAGVPFALFALMSAGKTVGLHWLASFVAPAIVLFALGAGERALRGALRFGAVLALVHYAVLAGLWLAPLEWFKSSRSYDGLVMTLRPQALNEKIAPYLDRFEIAANGYSPAVTIGFNLKRYVFVFGPASSHARHDDILTDFRRLDGRDILVIRKERPEPENYAPYFERVEYREVDVLGATFHFVEGRGFRYAAYRDAVLDEARRRWYAVPAWLPAGPCYFCDRYFPDRSCHR